VLRHHFGQSLKYIGYGGAGKQVRDVLHIDDLADLVLEQIRGFDDWEGWCGNVGGGREISCSLKELTELCREIMRREVPIASDPEPRQADLRIFLADCSRLFEKTEWRPSRDVKRIVSDIAAWTRVNEELLAPVMGIS
jgi:CDP-paratose 2-epimerase